MPQSPVKPFDPVREHLLAAYEREWGQRPASNTTDYEIIVAFTEMTWSAPMAAAATWARVLTAAGTAGPLEPHETLDARLLSAYIDERGALPSPKFPESQVMEAITDTIATWDDPLEGFRSWGRALHDASRSKPKQSVYFAAREAVAAYDRTREHSCTQCEESQPCFAAHGLADRASNALEQFRIVAGLSEGEDYLDAARDVLKAGPAS
jgi:hypothetical protein